MIESGIIYTSPNYDGSFIGNSDGSLSRITNKADELLIVERPVPDEWTPVEQELNQKPSNELNLTPTIHNPEKPGEWIKYEEWKAMERFKQFPLTPDECIKPSGSNLSYSGKRPTFPVFDEAGDPRLMSESEAKKLVETFEGFKPKRLSGYDGCPYDNPTDIISF